MWPRWACTRVEGVSPWPLQPRSLALPLAAAAEAGKRALPHTQPASQPANALKGLPPKRLAKLIGCEKRYRKIQTASYEDQLLANVGLTFSSAQSCSKSGFGGNSAFSFPPRKSGGGSLCRQTEESSGERGGWKLLPDRYPLVKFALAAPRGEEGREERGHEEEEAEEDEDDEEEEEALRKKLSAVYQRKEKEGEKILSP